MDNLNVAIIGTGFGKRVLLPCLDYASGIRVKYLVSRDNKGNDLKDISVIKFSDLLLDDEIDLVCIATPPFTHYDKVLNLVKYNKNILCEKPFALNVMQCNQMVKASKDKNLLTAVNHQLRFHKNFQKINEIIKNNMLGVVRHVQINYLSSTCFDSDRQWSWWMNLAKGGGQVNALGSHFIDLLQWWFGKIINVNANLHTFNKTRLSSSGKSKEVTSDEYASINIEFESGEVGHILTSSVVNDDICFQLKIIGSKKTLELTKNDKLLLHSLDSQTVDLTEVDSLLHEPKIGVNRWRRSMVRYAMHIRDVIKKNENFIGSTFIDGLEVQKVLDAVQLSNKERRIVPINEIKM